MPPKSARPLSVFAPSDIPLLKRTIISALRKDKEIYSWEDQTQLLHLYHRLGRIDSSSQ